MMNCGQSAVTSKTNWSILPMNAPASSGRNGTFTSSQVLAGGVFLEPYSLTIGFARRFATYKRANLMFRDFDRLMTLINHPHMPVQIIFAGKAHPADEPGKLLIQQVYRAVKDIPCRRTPDLPRRLRH